MLDEKVKEEYCDVLPPEDLKERVMDACAAAKKKKRAAMKKRITSAAACFVILIGVVAYNATPVPVLSSNGQEIQQGVLCVVPEPILAAQENPQQYNLGIQTASAGELLENCIPLVMDRTSTVKVSDGTLYLLDETSGIAEDMGKACKVEAGTQIYWQCEKEEGATIKLRSDLRTISLHLALADGQWWLYR